MAHAAPKRRCPRVAHPSLLTALLRSNDKGHRALVLEAFCQLPTREVLRALRVCRENKGLLDGVLEGLGLTDRAIAVGLEFPAPCGCSPWPWGRSQRSAGPLARCRSAGRTEPKSSFRRAAN